MGPMRIAAVAGDHSASLQLDPRQVPRASSRLRMVPKCLAALHGDLGVVVLNPIILEWALAGVFMEAFFSLCRCPI